jgi:hypothetical protein
MAGDWIPMRLDLCDDPAVLEMADITNQPEEYIVGCLHRIWSWASRNCHDGTVTGVTKMSLSRAVRLPEVVSAMVKVGWLIEGSTDDGRPFVQFPKWENWLSKSAKSRINNAINQRKSRANKSTAVNQDPKTIHGAVTNLSQSNSDGTVTTEENSTEEDKDDLFLSVCADDLNGLIGRDVICPDWLREWFIRWLDWRWHDSGKKPPATLQQTWVLDLSSRGEAKAIQDLQFSISKQAKNILRSENDLDKVTKARIDLANRPIGKETAAEAAKRIFGG